MCNGEEYLLSDSIGAQIFSRFVCPGLKQTQSEHVRDVEARHARASPRLPVRPFPCEEPRCLPGAGPFMDERHKFRLIVNLDNETNSHLFRGLSISRRVVVENERVSGYYS